MPPRRGQKAPPRRGQKAPPRRGQKAPPRRRGVVCIMLVATALFVAAATSQVWTRMRAIQYGYQISEASKRNLKLLETHRQLRIEAALLKSPARVARTAVEELGMHYPRPDQIRKLRLGHVPHLAKVSP